MNPAGISFHSPESGLAARSTPRLPAIPDLEGEDGPAIRGALIVRRAVLLASRSTRTSRTHNAGNTTTGVAACESHRRVVIVWIPP